MNRFKLFSILIFLFSLLNCSTFQDKSVNESKKEIQVGRALAAKLMRKYGLIKNEEFTRYLNALGQRIVNVSSRQDLNFRFGILNTKEINAFACPGGYVLLTLGVLNQIENEAQLVAILAHEIAHITLNHTGVFQEKMSWTTFVLDAIAGMLGPDTGIVSAAADIATSEIEKILFETGRQKNLEIEADIAGMVLASNLKYDGNVYLNFLRKTDGRAEKNSYLKTHPKTEDRISSIYEFVKVQKINMDGKTSEVRFKKYFSLIKNISDQVSNSNP